MSIVTRPETRKGQDKFARGILGMLDATRKASDAGLWAVCIESCEGPRGVAVRR